MKPIPRFSGRLLLCTALGMAVSAIAHANDALQRCAAIRDNDARLQCYDALAARTAASPPPANPATSGNSAQTQQVASDTLNNSPRRSYLTRAWNLDGRAGRNHPGRMSPLRPYRQSYLIVRASNSPNTTPHSPAAGHAVTTPQSLDSAEAKFQFSFKSEIMHYHEIDWLGFRSFRLWGAYTQQSNWQAFNTRNSSPFRETNYEPELIATFGTGKQDGLKLVNLGIEHQSNGQSLPQSRSWNRIYLQGGWEWNDNLSLLARGWWRIPENPQQDDNPDILNYIGRADAVLRWAPDGEQVVSLLLRNNLNLGHNRGFAQIDWTTPIKLGDSAKLFVQYTNGFGESLIDYNYQQQTLGLGIAFRDW